jgi:ribosomal protein S18 acetylase RimI-like enzyme
MTGTRKPRAQVQIEPVNPAEFEELAKLASDSFADTFGHTMTDEELRQSLAESRSVAYFEKTFSSSTILVAKEADRIVGYVQYGDVKIPEIKDRDDAQELGRLYVATDHHGQGIGRRLMDTALADPAMESAAKIYLQVWDQNYKAIPLYESCGFKTVGVTYFEVAGRPMQDLIMLREQKP